MGYVPEYYRGQGRMFVAPIVNGVRQQARWVGNVPTLSIGVEVEKVEHKESYSGQALVDLTLLTETKTSFNTTIEEFSKENLAMAFRGGVVSVQSGKVLSEVGRDTVAVGDVWFLGNVGVSNLKITDSSGVVLKAGEHYQVDEAFGRVTLLKTATLSAPLTAAYDFSAREEIEFMQSTVDGYYIRFEGLNTAASNAPVLIEMYKVDIDPAKTLSLIQDEMASFELSGNVLAVNGKTVKITKL